MKKITLLKDLETQDGYFKAGEEVEVSDEHYDWLMGIYMAERAVQVQQMKEGEKRIKSWGLKDE